MSPADDLPVATTLRVTVTHLADDAHPQLTACGPQRLPDYSGLTGPSLLCPLCRHYADGGCGRVRAPAAGHPAVDLPSPA